MENYAFHRLGIEPAGSRKCAKCDLAWNVLAFGLSTQRFFEILGASHSNPCESFPVIDTVSIKLANYASKAKCSVLVDAQGNLCLFERFQDDDGQRVVRFAPIEGAYYPEGRWLAAIAAGNASKMIAWIKASESQSKSPSKEGDSFLQRALTMPTDLARLLLRP